MAIRFGGRYTFLMAFYRRARIPGARYFLTAVTWRRHRLLQSPSAVARLREALRSVMREQPFTLLAAAILPDHFHVMIELPDGDAAYPARMGRIKAAFTKSMPISPERAAARSHSRRRKREQMVWQRRYWEHTIRDDADFSDHMNYIHYNAVKHGYAACPHAWPYSSFQTWVRKGLYPATWLCGCDGRRVAPPRFDELAGKRRR